MKHLFSFFLSITFLTGFANPSFWQNVSNKKLELKGERKITPQQSNVVQLDDMAFLSFLQTIPTEASGQFALLSLPTPDGTIKNFKVFERTCMEKELADRYPMIKTYQAIAVENPAITAKLDYTPFGFHAMVFDNDKTYFIDPYTNINTGYYNCYYKKGYMRSNAQVAACETHGKPTIVTDDGIAQRLMQQHIDNQDPTAITSPGLKRTFRLALSCTIEYSAAVGGPTPTKATVLAAMVTSVNRINGVYEKELSIHMNLVARNDTLIFINSDNFSNNNGGSMLGQNQTVCDARIGNANYDIGHVFSTGGGGVAFLGVICSAGEKAQGVTGSSNPVGDAYDIDYVAHEMGHQFGANHTFNANSGSCSGNREASVAYEPGSGTTIMAYAGICTTNDVAQHSDDYFHRASLNEIYTYISSTSCAVTANNGNASPTVNNYLSTYYIPYKTSFEITASATDLGGRPISYCWEEWDLGPGGNWNATNNTTAPLFRSFLPSSSSTRVFPIWDSLINNSIKYRGEVLPEVARDTKFRCTVRNINVDGYGAYNAPDVNLTLKSIVTPSLFRVNSFPTLSTITGNTQQTITWDVAGTTASPISCANVDIYLSLDSARTFPYLLANNVANDGSEVVTIPNVVTANASARIKVKGNGNVFFDLNNGWIKINQGIITTVASFTTSDTVICEGSSSTFTNTSTGSPDSVRWTINGGTVTTSTSSTTVTSTFNTAGSYTVSLIAYKTGIASVPYSKTIVVKPKKVTNLTQSVCSGGSVTIGNETFTTSGLHTVVLQSSLGCDSTVNLTLTVNPKPVTSLTQSVCSGGSVTIGNQTFTTSGLHTVVLQSSLGCDSTVNLTLTVNPKPITNLTQSVCSGGSVTIGNQTFTTSGLHTVVLQSSLGCDSTVNLTLTVNPKPITNLTQSVCSGGSVTIGNQTFTTSGLHTVVLQSSLGCDSTVNLTLIVNPKPVTNLTQSVCNGESVTIGNEIFTTSGLHTVVLQSSLGCDSTVNLTLTVNPKPVTNLTQSVCSGGSVTIGNEIFTTSGLHTVVLQSSLGCDSTVNLTLTVNPKPVTNLTQSVCNGESVTIGNEIFTTSGLHTVVLQSSLGCDSTVNLSLTVNPTPIVALNETICQGNSITVGNETFTTSGSHTVVLQSSLGCDSTVNLSLTVNPTPIVALNETICQGNSITVGNETFTTSGLHTVILQTSLGCDSTVNLNLSVEALPTTPSITQINDTLFCNVIISGATYNWYKAGVLVNSSLSPFYKLSSGEINFTLKVISQYNCESEISVPFNPMPTSIKSNKLDVSFSILPNPNNGSFEINITSDKNTIYHLSIYNVAGQEISSEDVNIQKGKNNKLMHLTAIEKGMYFIMLTGKDGVLTQSIIVQ
jgi:hypothetical protein